MSSVDKRWYVAVRIRNEANARFISNARQDIPALVAEVRRLRTAIRDLINGDAGFVVSDTSDYRGTKNETCIHNQYRWQGCGYCTDTYLQKLLDGEPK